MAGSAIFIGLCALFVSINQTRIMRKQHESSIWPYIYHGITYRDDGRFFYNVRNVGLGPAKIVNARIYYKDKVYSGYYQFLSDFLEIPVDSVKTGIALGYSTLDGRVLAPEESIDALNISTWEVSAALFDRQDEWHIKICFCSIYNKCWSNITFGDAEETDNCE